MNKRRDLLYIFIISALIMPSSLFAGGKADAIRNFIEISPDNPFLPVLILIGCVFAIVTFLFPRVGLLFMLVFMLISTDMQLDQSTEGRGASIRLEDIILLLVSGGWLLNRAKNRSLTMFRSVPVNKSILMMALVIVISFVLGHFQETMPIKRGILFTLKRLEYFWLFFMTLNIMETDKEVKIAVNILIFLTILVSLVGAIQFYLFPLSGLTGGGATATSGFGRANTLADFYLIVGGIFLGLVIYSKSRKRTIFYILVMSLCSLALIMTKSRGAYVSIPPLIFVIAFFSRDRRILWLTGVGTIVCLVYFLGMFLLSTSSSQIAHGAGVLTQKHTGDIGNQFESIGDIVKAGPEADSSFNARYSSWVNNIPNIFEYPLFGHGVGSVPLSYFDCQHVREMYETGLIGFLIFLYMNLSIFMAVLTLFYMTNDPLTKGLSCGFLGGHVAMMVHGWSIANFYTIMNMEVFWFIVALLMILYHNHISRLNKENEGESA